MLENVLLKEIVNFRVGGAARYFVEVKDLSQLSKALEFCKEKNLPYFILGNGSNSLFNDSGFDGVVIKNSISFCEFFGDQCHVGSGFSFSRLGVQTASRNLSGLEFAAGIPGTVGGAIFMNAGANGQEISQVLSSVVYFDGEERIIEKFGFGYRCSSFQEMDGVIISAIFDLKKDVNAGKKQREMLLYRKETQPLNELTLGCTFRNPDGASAAKLIQNSGLKGVSVGDAIVSDRHANFIVNRGQASSNDVLELISLIKKEVKAKTGYVLQEEIRTFR